MECRWISFVGETLKLAINPDSSVLKTIRTVVPVSERDQINYNAPEYAFKQCVDVAYDVWCVGWLVYHMCTWHDPFDALDGIADTKLAWTNIALALPPRRFNADLCRLFNKYIYK